QPRRALGPAPVVHALEPDARHPRGQRLLREDPARALEEVRQRERVVHDQVVDRSGHRRPPGATSPRSSDVAQRNPTTCWPLAARRRSYDPRLVTLSASSGSSWLAPPPTPRPAPVPDCRPRHAQKAPASSHETATGWWP